MGEGHPLAPVSYLLLSPLNEWVKGTPLPPSVTSSSSSLSPVPYFSSNPSFDPSLSVKLLSPCPLFQSDPVVLAKAKAATGLALLHSKKYKQVCRCGSTSR